MRSLAPLALTLSTLAAQAEPGPPTPAELAEARATCATEVGQACLFTLAVDAALASTDPHPVLNHIATIQAIEGDAAGADRTLALTRPDALALLALGRVEEAQTALQRKFADLEAMTGIATEGPLDVPMLLRMSILGRSDLALSTPLAASGMGKVDVLPLIFSDHLKAGRIGEAVRIYAQMDKSDRDSGKRLLRLIDALCEVGNLEEAAGLVTDQPDPQTQALARITLAKAYLAAGLTTQAAGEFDSILASVTDGATFPDWTIAVLARSADLALQAGETAIARQHANTAFKSYDQ
jgi:tetratricopeptide (TPR) repeat protein